MQVRFLYGRTYQLFQERQAFMLYWALHQVWDQPNITVLIWVAKLIEHMLWIQSMPNGN